jgi:hypothetical protein
MMGAPNNKGFDEARSRSLKHSQNNIGSEDDVETR